MTHPKARLSSVLGSSLKSLLYPQVVLLMFIPFLVSIALVGFGLWLSWGFWMNFFVSGTLALQTYWVWLLENTPESFHFLFRVLSSVAPWILFFALFALSFPIVIMLNLMMVSFLASTYLVKLIARREYPDLDPKGHPRFLKGFANTFASSVLFLFFWVITLPLWLIPGLALILPLLLTAWFNRRICTFDALTDFATDSELKYHQDLNSTSGFVLGLMTAGLNYLPLGFLVAPILTMLAFIHLNLSSLRLARADVAQLSLT